VSKHQLQRSPIRFKGRADPSHIYLNSDRLSLAEPRRSVGGRACQHRL